MTTRRRFITLLPQGSTALLALGSTALLAPGQATAQASALDPKDAQATALGYNPDANQVDKAKYPKYAAGQQCAGCQLYQGTGSATAGPCPIFPNKLVAAKGWCSAFVKKG